MGHQGPFVVAVLVSRSWSVVVVSSGRGLAGARQGAGPGPGAFPTPARRVVLTWAFPIIAGNVTGPPAASLSLRFRYPGCARAEDRARGVPTIHAGADKGLDFRYTIPGCLLQFTAGPDAAGTSVRPGVARAPACWRDRTGGSWPEGPDGEVTGDATGARRGIRWWAGRRRVRSGRDGDTRAAGREVRPVPGGKDGLARPVPR
ncbi:hypothetical protein FRACA_2530003 [Frankia canadensis]|uniref:Uncharacterized protein n=1 Tax=Frankia canadensis TaxID=1836972 RepID=A0A2I2KS66_9ACTN|nr:hypothetical protein FRACA_2530003 [Frankia canadensis]SOU55792.1 hypothetical protein FRACA_2530003 [Frankia canadensis]